MPSSMFNGRSFLEIEFILPQLHRCAIDNTCLDYGTITSERSRLTDVTKAKTDFFRFEQHRGLTVLRFPARNSAVA